jgi:hypothetical protein
MELSVDTFAQRRRLVVRDSVAWAKVWIAFGGRHSAPRLDFSQEMVIVVAGRTYTGIGPYTRIDSLRLQGWELTAYVRTGSCDGPWIGPDMMSTLAAAIAVPAKFAQVHFAESHESIWGCYTERPDTTA